MAVKPRIKLTPGKTYTYTGTEGVYTVVMGEVVEGDGVNPGNAPTLSSSTSAPTSGSGKSGDIHIDRTNFKLYTRGANDWDAGVVFKGANGSNGSNGSNGAAGLNGKGIKWGNGAPTDPPGEDDDLFFDIENQRIYPKSAGAWSDAGKKSFKGTNGSNGINGTKLLQGTSAPGVGDGDDGDTFLDAVNHTIYKKQAGSWVSQGSSFKGTKGDNGSKGDAGKRGKTTLEGDGPPGSGTNLATPTAALTSALADESMTSADLEVGDLYVDTTNHRFYRKTTLGWTARSVFRGTDGAQGLKGDTGSTGPQGLKGDTGLKGDNGLKGDTGSAGAKGDTGDGVNIYSIGLDADKQLVEGAASQLYFSDVETNLGAIVTASGTSVSGSTFTIASGKSGRYRIELTVGLKTTGTNGATWSASGSIKINGAEKESTTRSGTVISVTGPVTGYKSLFVTYTGYLREGATIRCYASYDSGTVTSMYANALDRTTETGDDTSVVITKL